MRARRACHAVTAVCEYRGGGFVVADGAHSRDAVFDPCIELVSACGERGGFRCQDVAWRGGAYGEALFPIVWTCQAAPNGCGDGGAYG